MDRLVHAAIPLALAKYARLVTTAVMAAARSRFSARARGATLPTRRTRFCARAQSELAYPSCLIRCPRRPLSEAHPLPPVPLLVHMARIERPSAAIALHVRRDTVAQADPRYRCRSRVPPARAFTTEMEISRLATPVVRARTRQVVLHLACRVRAHRATLRGIALTTTLAYRIMSAALARQGRVLFVRRDRAVPAAMGTPVHAGALQDTGQQL